MKDMDVFVIDELSPQENAMLQALYSRSNESARVHIDKVRKTSSKFMEKYYVNYNHKSIGDGGSTTAFIEGVSMLVAKATQDNQLYSGQETSSRYMNMSEREIFDPIHTNTSVEILGKWMTFYTGEQSLVEEHLRAKYPKKPEEDEAAYNGAIKARVFDIMRGFLPAGITTQLSWHTNLRQAYDHLALLIHHPLAEVRAAAESMLTELKGKYPESFSQKIYPEQEAYREKMAELYTYYMGAVPVKIDQKIAGLEDCFTKKAMSIRNFRGETSIDVEELMQYGPAIKERPQKTELPTFLEELGQVSFKFLLDFGSFRDIQRHRHGVCRMPLLIPHWGFQEWYLEQLPDPSRKRAEKLIDEQTEAIKNLKASHEIKQYYCAMGYNVSCKVTYGLPATVYVIELRSSKTVHPTLRKVAHQMYWYVHETFPELALHADIDPDDWDIRRGLQDIKERK